MPADLLAGIDANTRNKIVFTLEGTDAKAVASGSDLAPEDFMRLPPYGIYASLLSEGRQTGWFSGRTLPPPSAISSPETIIRESQARYGADPNISRARAEDTPASEAQCGGRALRSYAARSVVMSHYRRLADAPLTHPVTMLSTSGNRRNVRHIESLGEATIRGIPLMCRRRPDFRRGG